MLAPCSGWKCSQVAPCLKEQWHLLANTAQEERVVCGTCYSPCSLWRASEGHIEAQTQSRLKEGKARDLKRGNMAAPGDCNAWSVRLLGASWPPKEKEKLHLLSDHALEATAVAGGHSLQSGRSFSLEHSLHTGANDGPMGTEYALQCQVLDRGEAVVIS